MSYAIELLWCFCDTFTGLNSGEVCFHVLCGINKADFSFRADFHRHAVIGLHWMKVLPIKDLSCKIFFFFFCTDKWVNVFLKNAILKGILVLTDANWGKKNTANKHDLFMCELNMCAPVYVYTWNVYAIVCIRNCVCWAQCRSKHDSLQSRVRAYWLSKLNSLSRSWRIPDHTQSWNPFQITLNLGIRC